jgi:hypothetical protein
VTYYPDDTVTYNGASYINSVTHTSTNDTNINTGFPPNATNSWSVFAAAGTSGTAGVSGTNGTAGSGGANGTNGVNGTNGTAGGPGPGVVFRGNYLLGETYFFTATRRDIVKSGSTYYLFATSTDEFGTTSHSAPPSANWTAFGAQFSSVATDILLAQDATITRGLVMGAGDGGSSFIRSSGATSLTSGNGYFLSSSGDFRFGNPAGNSVNWNGTTLSVNGTVTAAAGSIGGWTINTNEISNTTSGNTIKLDSANNKIQLIEGSDVRFDVSTENTLPISPNSSGIFVSGPRGVFISRAGFAVGRDNQRYFRNVTVGETPLLGKSFVFNDTKGGFRTDILTFHTPQLSEDYFKFPTSSLTLDNDSIFPYKLVGGVPDTSADGFVWMPRTQEAIIYDRPGDPVGAYRSGSQSYNNFGLQTGGGVTIGTTTFRVHTGAPITDTLYGGAIQRLSFRVDTDGNVQIPILPNGTVSAGASVGQLSTSSDKNLKIDAGFIENAIDKVLGLKPRYFYWKDPALSSIKQLGFYAQEVNEISEESANTPAEGVGWGIYDRGLIAILTKAIQEQQEIIENLKKDIDELKSKI